MHTIQLAPAQWLVLDNAVRPRFLLAVAGGMLAAQDWCRVELERDAKSKAQISENVARRGF